MILEVDIGNSRIKWRLRSQKTVIASSMNHRSDDSMDSIFDLGALQPASVWVSTVVPRIGQKFSQWSRHRLGIQPQYALVTGRRAGVTNGYRAPSQMGVDRWLAMLAAFQITRRACVVIDCGTACTVDVIDHDGRHRGGYIAPGLQMMSDSLSHATAGLASLSIAYLMPPVPGRSTDTAVSAGLSAMIIGMIEYALADNSPGTDKPSVLLTGGDGQKFQQLLTKRLGVQVDFNASLVLEGLQYALLTENGSLSEPN